MGKRRIRLVAACIAAAFGVGLAAAFAAHGQAPGAITSATAPDYRSEPVVLRPAVEGRRKPVVVVLADNEGTETTDFIVPYGMLKESGVAEVRAVSSGPGVVELMPALRVRADRTIAEFERETPQGADVVVVPAMHRQDNPVILDFLKRQAAGGALIVSICDGAWVVAHAGLFEGRKATGHWFSFDGLARTFPGATWVRNARIVTDGPVMSTTGVSASIPASLALVEAISDRPTAERLAARLGAGDWNRPHDSDAFRVTGQMAWTALANLASFWRHEDLMVEAPDGFDEIALALQADAWSRTFRSKLTAVSDSGEVRSARGLMLVAEPAHRAGASLAMTPAAAGQALDHTLAAIGRRYGARTAGFVAMQLEYEPARLAEARQTPVPKAGAEEK